MSWSADRQSFGRAGLLHLRAILTLAALLLFGSLASAFEVEGHRGARALLPENTLPAFARALDLGVDVLEMDLALTADDIVVVAHDPLLNPAITRGPDGRWLSPPTPAIHALTLAGLRQFDVGRIDPTTAYAARFPDQQPVDGARVPTLAEVVELVVARALPVRFDLEIKTDPHHPEWTAPPERFARRVVETVHALGIADRSVIQSFNWRALAAVRALDPDLPTACLTSKARFLDNLERGRPGASPWLGGLDADDFASVPELVAAAGCRIWSARWQDVQPADVARAHALGLRVLVWTPNEVADIEAAVALGVDGVITDYPDRALALRARLRGLRSDAR
jgi:glycerophosphoryl diester phosphodiesterase